VDAAAAWNVGGCRGVEVGGTRSGGGRLIERVRLCQLEQTGAKTFVPGEVLAMPTGMIHQVWNQTVAVTVSLHIYGKHINHTGRSQFDVKNNAELPFVTRIAA
jgi:hypothetical protein